jgi:WD40 repeat protein
VTFGWGNYYVRYDLIRENNQIGLGRRTTFEKLIRVRGPLTFSRDAKYAAASVKSTDFMGVFLDIESGGVLHHFDPASARATNEGHEYGCNFAFTSDGQRVVGADHNGRVALWSFPEGELITELGQFHVDENHNPPRVAVTPEDLLITVGNYSDSRITIQSVADLN